MFTLALDMTSSKRILHHVALETMKPQYAICIVPPIVPLLVPRIPTTCLSHYRECSLGATCPTNLTTHVSHKLLRHVINLCAFERLCSSHRLAWHIVHKLVLEFMYESNVHVTCLAMLCAIPKIT